MIPRIRATFPGVPLASFLVALLLALLPAAFSSPARAQCTARWLPGESIAGVSGTVHATLGLANGDVIVGGAFTIAGGVNASNIARWQAATNTWAAIGSGVGGPVFAVAPLSSGDIVIAGSFQTAGGISAASIVRCNPATNTWTPLSSGLTGGDVAQLAITPTDEVLAVGSFSNAGGLTVAGLAAFNFALGEWSSLGITGERGLTSICFHPSGEIYVGGTNGPGGVTVTGIARRSLSGTWSSLGAGLSSGTAGAITVLDNGDLLVGGNFTAAGGLPAFGIARWSVASQSWSTFGAGIAGAAHEINALLVLPNNDFLVGGDFTLAGNLSVSNIARCNAITGVWSPVGAGATSPVTSLAAFPAGVSSGGVIVGGSFLTAGGIAASRVAQVDPATNGWKALGRGVDGTVNAIAALPALSGGDLFVGGAFSRAGSGPARNIARYHPATNTWTPLGAGVDGAVLAIAAASSGDIVIGGDFTAAGGGQANRIARWSAVNSTWSSFGTGISAGSEPGRVLAVAPAPSGDVYAAGAFAFAGGTLASNIARWNAASSSWSPLGSGTDLSVYALVLLPNGDLLAGGIFSRAGGVNANALARWNETTHVWSAVSTGVDASVYALLPLPSGDVIIAGDFLSAGNVPANRIVRWTPATNTFTPLGLGLEFQANALALTPPELGGDLIVGGSFTGAGGFPASRIARWRFSSAIWSPLGSGLNAPVNALATHPGGLGNGNVVGNIFAGGPFTTAGGQVSAYFATFASHPACPADFDCSGVLAPADIFAFLDAWFAGSPIANFDGVSSLQVQDIFAFINAWFAGC